MLNRLSLKMKLGLGFGMLLLLLVVTSGVAYRNVASLDEAAILVDRKVRSTAAIQKRKLQAAVLPRQAEYVVLNHRGRGVEPSMGMRVSGGKNEVDTRKEAWAGIRIDPDANGSK